MITWITTVPWYGIPGALLFFTGVIPDVVLLGQQMGGSLIRQWFINHLLLPVLPMQDAAVLSEWYMQTSYFGELLLHGLISLNVNALMLPFLYVAFSWFIALNNWFIKTDLDMKRRSAKR